MKTFVKMTAIAAILFISALTLVTCQPELLPEGSGTEPQYVDWEYEELPDGTANLTLYLDGTVVPVTPTTSRALGLQLAKMSHDYFEAVFVYGQGATAVVARAAWELGQAAGISGVQRSGGGVDYRPVTAPTSATTGASIVFVGRKQTMTLLGVGYLSQINKQPIVGNLMSTDRSVTFRVSALEAKIGVFTGDPLALNTSSFVTAARTPAATAPTISTTLANLTPLGGTEYPLFELPDWATHSSGTPTGPAITVMGTDLAANSYKTVAAEYTISGFTAPLVSPPPDFPTSLAPAVLLYDLPEVIKREPRYISGGQAWYATSRVDFSYTLVGVTGYTPIAGQAFDPKIPMTFYITQPSNGIFSIVFSVPVYALVTAAGGGPAPSTNGGPPGEIWHITPGYGQNLYNLDNGTDAGGCVLMGINVTSLDWLDIFTIGTGFTH